MQHLCLTFKAFCFLTLLWLLSPLSLINPPSIIDVCKLLGIRTRFQRLYERLRNDPYTLNKVSPESSIRNIYKFSLESINRSAYVNNPVVSQTFICKCVIVLPLFSTLLLTNEAPYVDVDGIVPYFV